MNANGIRQEYCGTEWHYYYMILVRSNCRMKEERDYMFKGIVEEVYKTINNFNTIFHPPNGFGFYPYNVSRIAVSPSRSARRS